MPSQPQIPHFRLMVIREDDLLTLGRVIRGYLRLRRVLAQLGETASSDPGRELLALRRITERMAEAMGTKPSLDGERT